MILCANHRLARHLRAAHDRARAAAGSATWTPLVALTPDAWLDAVTDEALLSGAIPAAEAPWLALSGAQERLLWEAAIGASAGEGEDALFDVEGLAQSAVEANDLCETWNLRPDADAGEETKRFLDWRRHVRRECQAHGWLEGARLRAWQIRRIAEGAGRLPAKLAFAGFDRYTPQEIELARVLEARGVEVVELALGRGAPGEAFVVDCADRRAGCRMAAAWAAERLARDPGARLGIVAPGLEGVREMLASALDDVLHPEALSPGSAEMPRRYNFSLGTPLARAGVVAVALRLLRVAANPRRCEQSDFSALLLGPYWSAFESEAEGRARLDAAMRRHLPPVAAVSRLLTFARRFEARGLPPFGRTLRHLDALAAINGRRRFPSDWSAALAELLAQAGWPGERGLSSHEWQARAAFLETLASMGGLDAMLGKVGIAEACRQLARLCRERVFQPETEGAAAIEVMGPLEAAGLEFDALWVLGMNDDAWPPPPRPNPLLPADLQRRVKSSNASAEVQLEFARSVHARLLAAAPEVVFSWAVGEGDRQLRMSPLIAGLPTLAHPPPPVASRIETQVGCGALERIDDHRAPPVAEGELVRGGTGLLRAQALCPAWAFWRYRLGAKPLDEPVEGLDAMDRGTLLHRVMEKFFSGRSQAELLAMSEPERCEAARAAVSSALASFGAEREEPLPPRFMALEQARLESLLAQWLELELARPAPFAVVACEAPAEVEIEGIAISLKVDRVDALEDGRRLILDYKTGGDLKPKLWEGDRIAEPQLPVYAAYAGEAPTAVAFAQVRAEDCAFVGLGAEAGLLPGVKAAEDWTATLDQWRAAIAAIAREIREGHAPVSFADEKDLKYCEVLPLLRLPEAKSQGESS
ncbi:MAG: PD-(D/E)XK nuclease family protein [Candidatus Nitricoxidivorans perseverans]|uniref:PD-(D/E)XK nuclease family protein n=1 Tax=Candidatus Nitricoxidivorans perseverans TaxID=2975601 RepID=A0AA49FLB4_9PROT|nr:MAG: PD-(D/E)XK nuclease family protein [Candidatus Nitricoxidivorans perseverans]